MTSKSQSSPNLSKIPIPPRKKSVTSYLTPKNENKQSAAVNGHEIVGINILSRKSKVGEYIREMKRNDDASKEILARGKRQDLHLSLEDLYLGQDSAEGELSPETAKRELRKNLRIVKEKDMVILKLREACQDLSVKYADAENTIDQIRFQGSRTLDRKSQSEFQICPTPQKDTKDQSTETTKDVLSEPCSSWVEKIKNWKTDSTFLASADADSGFRGSDLAEQEVPPGRQKPLSPRVSIVPMSSTPKSGNAIIISNHERASTNPWPTPRRSRSQTNLHWSIAEGPPTNHRHRVSLNQFESLDKLLDEATAHARRVQRKSEILSQLLHIQT